MTFAELFLALRRLLGLTQIEMAAQLGIKQPFLSKVEHCASFPAAATFVRMSLLAGNSPNEEIASRAEELFQQFYDQFEGFYGPPEVSPGRAVDRGRPRALRSARARGRKAKRDAVMMHEKGEGWRSINCTRRTRPRKSSG